MRNLKHSAIALLVLLGIFFLIRFSCHRHFSGAVHRSFYYWKTTYSLTLEDANYLDSLHIERLYVRLFDLTGNKAEPSNPIRFAQKAWFPKEIVPVIYISQEAVKGLGDKDTNTLAANLLMTVRNMTQKMGGVHFSEIQMDCDWVPSDKDQYFALLESLEKQKQSYFPGLIISATIRLHQVKYFLQTGVPPVEKGILMVYHTSSPFELKDQSSILDVREAENYLKDVANYPLPLDVALPLFSWVVQYNRDEKFIRILHGPEQKDLDQNPNLRKDGTTIYEATADTFLGDERVMKGDRLKLDKAEISDILEVESYLRTRLKNREINLILFHYDNDHIKRGTDDTFKDIEKIYAF